jgi:hypothetical protein
MSAWYYTWQCSGECAPGQLAISGVEGPFASYEECDGVRSADSRRDYFLAEGNLGGLNLCEEADAPPSPSGSSSSGGSSGGSQAVLARFILAAVAGPGYRVKDAAGIEPSTGTTAGAELVLHFGGHPILGVELGLGYQRSSVTAPHYGGAERTLSFLPITVGFTSTPALFRGDKVEVRLDLGADVGDLFQLDCASCDADQLPGDAFVFVLRGGLDTYFGARKSTGIGLDAVVMLGQLGALDDELTPSMIEELPPTFLVRVAFLARNSNGVAW